MKSTTCFLYWTPFFKLRFVLLWMQLLVTFREFSGVSANFNFYLDRREFQKLHGISSDIYYVREGVVNEYATSFLVTVPAEVDDLNFSWQALTKRPVFYEMTIDYTDFFALLPPLCNISKSGRVPENLEVFRLSLPCSGRSNAEVSVTIRIVFQIKHPKLNTTTINIKRNKICLFKDVPLPPLKGMPENSPGFPSVTLQTDTQSPNLRHKSTNGENPLESNDLSLFKNPTPALLLTGLLGGCAVTASAVFLTFFICLRRKLTPLASPHVSTHLPAYGSCHGDNDSSNNSSPACLLRQSQPSGGGTMTTQNSWKNFPLQASDTEKSGPPPPPLPRSGSHNSYITISSFWNDVLNSSSTGGNVRLTSNVKTSTTSKGSDVSPYAYAHVVHHPPLPKTGAPPFIEWYSQFPCQGINSPLVNSSSVPSNTNIDKTTHVYANNLPSTFCPKKYAGSSATRNSGENDVDTLTSGQNTALSLKSTTGSIIQVGGFQCRRNLAHEENVVERFL